MRKYYLREESKYNPKYAIVRTEKVNEIRAVWSSPKFRNNNERLVHLFRHCKKVEYGYTIREFGHALFPKYMEEGYKSDGEYTAFKNITKMFNRFNHDIENHEIMLCSALRKLKGDTVFRWYHYNMIDDEEAFKEAQLRYAKIHLGSQKSADRLEDIANDPRHDEKMKVVEKEIEETINEVKRKRLAELERKRKKGKRTKQEDAEQMTLDVNLKGVNLKDELLKN